MVTNGTSTVPPASSEAAGKARTTVLAVAADLVDRLTGIDTVPSAAGAMAGTATEDGRVMLTALGVALVAEMAP